MSFQGRTAAADLDVVSKAAWIDVATMLLHVIHEDDDNVDLRNPVELAALLLAYARPIVKARGDRDPLSTPPLFDTNGIAIRAAAAEWHAPAWDDKGGRG